MKPNRWYKVQTVCTGVYRMYRRYKVHTGCLHGRTSSLWIRDAAFGKSWVKVGMVIF